MTPIDFIVGGDHYNDTLGEHQAALTQPISLQGPDGEYEVLSYYMGSDARYVLDIQKKV